MSSYLPDHTIGDNHEPVIYQADNLSNPYQQSGTLAEWQQQIAAYCAGNSRLVLAVPVRLPRCYCIRRVRNPADCILSENPAPAKPPR